MAVKPLTFAPIRAEKLRRCWVNNLMRGLPAMESTPLTPENLGTFDCVLIATDHSAYDPAFLVQHSKMVLDTRNITKNVVDGREKIFKA